MPAAEISFKAKVMNGLFWLSAGTFSGQVLSWASTIFVMRLLLPSDYGLMAMATTATLLMTTISEFGVSASLIQAVRISDREIRQVFGFLLVTSIAMALVTWAAAPLVGHFYNEQNVVYLIRVLSIDIVVIAFYVLPESLLIREMNFKKKAAIDVSALLGSALLTLILAIQGYGVWALVAGHIMLHVIKAAGFTLMSSSRFRPLFDWTGAGKLIAYGLTVTGSRLFFYFHAVSDTIIVGKVLGNHFLGIYSVALHLATLPIDKIMPIINQVSFTSYSRIQADGERLKRNVLRGTRTVALTGFPLFFGMAGVAEEGLSTLLGPKWQHIVVPFQMLCMILPLKALAPVFGSAVFAVGKARVNLINTVLTFVIMTAAFLAGAGGGIQGVCLGWVIAYPLVFFITCARSLKALGIELKEYVTEIAFPLIASALVLTVIMLLRSLLTAARPAVLLALMVPAGIAVYAVLLVIFRKNEYLELKQLLQK